MPTKQKKSHASEEEGHGAHQAPDPGRRRQPGPPVGPALGQHGVNIMEFCKAYNAATESQRGDVIPVEITVYEDRSFTFITKTPPAAKMILKAAGVEKGSGEPHKTKVAKITPATRSARSPTTKMPDLNANDLEAAAEDHRRHRPFRWASRSRADPSRPGSRPPCRVLHRPVPRPLRHHEDRSASKRSKSYRAADAKIDRERCTPRSRPSVSPRRPRPPSSTGTVEVALRLGVDPRKADQMVRGTVNLPHGTGKTARVLVFATGDRAEAATAAGADIVGGDELIDEVAEGLRSTSTPSSPPRT